MRQITKNEIDELRKIIKHADLDDLNLELTSCDNVSLEIEEDIRKYLNHYAKFPRNEKGEIDKSNPCIGCGEAMGGSLTDQLLTRGGFTWGLAHGHGHCRNCGWPATLYHFINDRNGKELVTIRGILLQVHPDEVHIRETEL